MPGCSRWAHPRRAGSDRRSTPEHAAGRRSASPAPPAPAQQVGRAFAHLRARVAGRRFFDERHRRLAEAAKERIANADIDLELAREALTNLATEQLAWQFALRFYRDHDASALIEARRNGPVLLARLQRRHDFLQAMGDQVLARSGALGNELAQAPGAPDAADKRALRDGDVVTIGEAELRVGLGERTGPRCRRPSPSTVRRRACSG